MCQVGLGQLGHLGPGTDDALRPCSEQPWMCQVVLGQLGHLGPWTDDLRLMMLTDHVATTLDVPSCPRTVGTSQTWD